MVETPREPLPFETLAPADTAAVAEIVREAAREGRAIYPRGGGTSWNYGANPQRPGVTLSLKNMNRLVDHVADDMTITVEAGMTFAELSTILAAKNQRLPIDVPFPEKATLGGLLAVNQGGPRQFGYGTIKDYLLGFTAVDGEGTIFHGGARVVKNAAGYNMNRLMAGTHGTLAILTELTFMVRPRPELSGSVAGYVPDLPSAEKFLADLNKSRVRPIAVELDTNISESPVMLIVGFEGAAAEVRWMIETLQAEWPAGGDKPASAIHECEDPWRYRAEHHGYLRIAVPPSQVIDFIIALKEKYNDSIVQSHAGNGIVFLESIREHEQDWVEYYLQVRSVAKSLGGTMTVLSCPQNLELSREDIWGPPPSGFSIMRSLKERFDPQNLFNPGRFIFD